MLDRYLERSYELLTAGKSEPERTIIGPDLLRSMGVDETHIIYGVNILNFAALRSIYSDPVKRLPSYVTTRIKNPMEVANLCLNERQFFQGTDRHTYDHIVNSVSRALVGKSWREHQAATQAFQGGGELRRNSICPCGSGMKYKHCHGKYV